MLINSIPIIDYDELKNLKTHYNVLGIHVDFSILKSNNVIQSLLKINFPFFLSVDFTSINSNNINTAINNLIALTFNLSYLKENKKPLLLFCGDEPINAEIKSLIENAFTNQGYSKINTHQIISNKNNFYFNSDTLFITNANIDNDMNELYNSLSEKSTNTKLFIKTSVNEIDNLIKKIEEIENKFAQSHQKLYLSYTKIQELNNQNNKLESYNKDLNTQIQNFTTNQKLLKEDASNIINWYKKEVDKIKAWYNKEYETLPSWYKKIGHLIKKSKK